MDSSSVIDAALPDFDIHVWGEYDVPGCSIREVTISGTHRGEYFGIAPTGKRVTFNSTDIIKVRDGFMVEHWGAADLFGLTRQLKG